MHRVGFWINDNADVGVLIVFAVVAALFLLGSRTDDQWQIKSRPTRSPIGEGHIETSRRVRRSLAHYGNPYYTTNYITLASLFLSALNPAGFFADRPCSTLFTAFDFGKYLLIGALLLFWLGARAANQTGTELELEVELAERVYEPLHLRLRALYARLGTAVFILGATLDFVAFEASKALCR